MRLETELVRANRAIVLAELGRLDEAVLALDDVIVRSRRNGQDRPLATALVMRGYVAVKLGDFDEADVSAHETLRLTRDRARTRHQHHAHLILANVAAARGDESATRMRVEQGLLLAREDITRFHSRALSLAFSAALRLGDAGYARELLERFRAYADELDQPTQKVREMIERHTEELRELEASKDTSYPVAWSATARRGRRCVDGRPSVREAQCSPCLVVGWSTPPSSSPTPSRRPLDRRRGRG